MQSGSGTSIISTKNLYRVWCGVPASIAIGVLVSTWQIKVKIVLLVAIFLKRYFVDRILAIIENEARLDLQIKVPY